MKLVALCGLHGAGKDTVADALPAQKFAFADTLYREVAEAFGVTVAFLQHRENKEAPAIELALMNCADTDFEPFLAERNILDDRGPRSPRQILQWWGDYRRAQAPDYFVAATEFQVLLSDDVVITDVRYPNEARMVRQLGGQIWQIVRPGHNPPRNGHASENDGSAFAPDVVIINNGTIEELRATALREWRKCST